MPVTPVAMGKSTGGVELESVDDLDDRQFAVWMKPVAAVPGVGRKKREVQGDVDTVVSDSLERGSR
jgi:hypothetical protein